MGKMPCEAGRKDKRLNTLLSRDCKASKALDLARSHMGVLFLRGALVLAGQWLWKLVLTLGFNLQPNPSGRNSYPALGAEKIPLLRTLKPLFHEITIM